MKEYEKLAKKIIENKWFKPMQGKKEDPAHPAIHPTGISARFEEGPERNVYDLIVRRFLSAFAPEAIRQRVRIEADFGGQIYSSSGGTVTSKGWTEFYGSYFTTEDVELPPFKVGQKVVGKDPKKEKKETKPPKRYTQASLVSELEDRHLGTKSTRAVVIDTLAKRGYTDGTSSITVSDFGIKISDVLAKYAPEIMDENLTRKIEDEMEGIQNGKINKDDVIKEGQEILTKILDKWKPNEEQIGKELLDALKVTQQKENILGNCDKCTNKLRIIRMRDGRQFIGCYGYPNCRNAYPLPGGAIVKPTEKTCKDCNKPTINVKKGKTRYTMCVDPNCPSKLKWKTSKVSETNETDSKS